MVVGPAYAVCALLILTSAHAQKTSEGRRLSQSSRRHERPERAEDDRAADEEQEEGPGPRRGRSIKKSFIGLFATSWHLSAFGGVGSRRTWIQPREPEAQAIPAPRLLSSQDPESIYIQDSLLAGCSGGRRPSFAPAIGLFQGGLQGSQERTVFWSQIPF